MPPLFETGGVAYRARVWLTLWLAAMGATLFFQPNQSPNYDLHRQVMPIKWWGICFILVAVLRAYFLIRGDKSYSLVGAITAGYVMLFAIPFFLQSLLFDMPLSTGSITYSFIAGLVLLMSAIPHGGKHD